MIFSSKVISQQLIRQTLSCVGNSHTMNGITISQTIGQPSSTSSEKVYGIVLNQGFQQSLFFNSKIPQFKNLEVSAYPNPTNSVINLEIISKNMLDLNMNVHNSIGKLITEMKVSGMNLTLNFQHREPGMYFISFYSKDGYSKTIKITKIK